MSFVYVESLDQLAAECRLAASGFTDKTAPTDEKAEEIVDEVEGLVDTVLGTRYALPLTAAKNIAMVRGMIVLPLAAERVRYISPVGNTGKPEENPFWVNAENARKLLNRLLMGELTLAGEQPSDGPQTVAYKMCSGNGHETVFRRGEHQW